MQLGMIGLGRMGANMVRRLMRNDHQCVVHDRDAAAVDALVREGATGAATIEHLEAVTAAQRELYHSLTSEELIQAVTGHLRLAKVLMHETPREELRRRLAAIVEDRSCTLAKAGMRLAC